MLNINIKNTVPNVLRKNGIPNAWVSKFQTTRSGEGITILAGMPIGLLLTLTYAEGFQNLAQYSDFRPNVRIKNN